MKLIEQIPLNNGLCVQVYDLSQPIARDTVRVEILVKIPLQLRPDDFTEPSQYEKTRAVFGDEIAYERRLVQSFVNNDEQEQTCAALLDNFRRASLPYLAHPDFRTRFAASKYRDILQNPFKYSFMQQDRTEPA